MIHIVTFADEKMSRAADLCIKSALANGAESYWLYNPQILESRDIVKANPEVFRQPEDPRRAWAWWAFKPVIILEAMEDAQENSIVAYSDAGIEFLNNLNFIADRMDRDVWLFGNSWPHYAWTKRDTIDLVWPGSDWNNYGRQVQASVIAFRVSDYSKRFVKEWLAWCLFEGGRLIDDSPSRAPNHEEFREHRHDQSILCTLAYRERLRLHHWAASYNGGAFSYPKDGFESDDYPVLVNHHRKRNADF